MTISRLVRSNLLVVALLSMYVLHACNDDPASDTDPMVDAAADAAVDADTDAVVDSSGGGDGDDESDVDFSDAAADSDIEGDIDNDILSRPCDTPIAFPPFREALIPLDGQVIFPVALGGDPGPFSLLVDTGAVWTTIDTDTLAAVTGGVNDVSIDFGEGFVLEAYRVRSRDFSAAMEHIGVEIHGVIGQDLFRRFYFGLDYAGSAVTIGAGLPIEPPPRFATTDVVDVPFDIEQGLPIIDVDIGGERARLVADTGSGVTILTESLVDPLIHENGVDGYIWHTSYGSDQGFVVRIPELEISGEVVENSWAVVVPDDHHLAEYFRLIGVDMQGFLGFPAYRRFFISIRGCENRYLFYPEEDFDHIDSHEWDRVGVDIMRAGDDAVVDMVFEPSDASDQGVQGRDVLVAIDGVSTSGRSLDEIRLDLRGEPAKTMVLSIERGGAPIEVSVEVDRLLSPLE